jgi:hypothetical protein
MISKLPPPKFRPAIDYQPGDGPVLVTATGAIHTMEELFASRRLGYRDWLMSGTAVGVVGNQTQTVANFADDVAEPKLPANFTEDFGQFLNRNFPASIMDFIGAIERHTVLRGVKQAGRARDWRKLG